MPVTYTLSDLFFVAGCVGGAAFIFTGLFYSARTKRHEGSRSSHWRAFMPAPSELSRRDDVIRPIRLRPLVHFAEATAKLVWQAPWDCKVTRISYHASKTEMLSLKDVVHVHVQDGVIVEAVHAAFLTGVPLSAFLAKGARLGIQAPSYDGAWVIYGVRRGDV